MSWIYLACPSSCGPMQWMMQQSRWPSLMRALQTRMRSEVMQAERTVRSSACRWRRQHLFARPFAPSSLSTPSHRCWIRVQW